MQNTQTWRVFLILEVINYELFDEKKMFMVVFIIILFVLKVALQVTAIQGYSIITTSFYQ